ncbi:histidine phosphatase family protein [Xylanibacillus composti]|uniref:Histidine phosphatase family protein n=1 Tax=Xylanibacillus composti TaxID=1572762 RepID=A0A8J4GYN6_9BACL|nr:histidine phosphatase family protein [Xylanibacillus composti]MDT9725543.1 histidine phosphatase family protein [Xylanibacillus composti]GIQ67637.1 hypothetical protein XYCOK13_04610 [Xylanibacillus composti]
MRLYIIRHAEPDNPRQTITEQGHREAEALSRRMERLEPDKLYVSPLARAIHTLRYTADKLGKQAETLEWIQEIPHEKLLVQPWGALSPWDIPGEKLRGPGNPPTLETWGQFPELASFDAAGIYRHIQSESDQWLAKLGYVRDGGRYRIARANRDRIAVFCHNGFALTWLAHLLDIPLHLMWSGFWLPPSSVTTVLFDERSDSWAVPRCIGMADVSHLYEAGIPVSTHGLKANTE